MNSIYTWIVIGLIVLAGGAYWYTTSQGPRQTDDMMGDESAMMHDDAMATSSDDAMMHDDSMTGVDASASVEGDAMMAHY